MPIPIGILAASGAGASPSMELISTQTATTQVSSFTFSSIPQGYKHLQIRGFLQSSSSGTSVIARINNLTSGYASTRYTASGTTITVSSESSDNYMRFPSAQQGNNTTNYYSTTVFDILGYSDTTTTTTMKCVSGISGLNYALSLASAMVNTTGAVSSITFYDGTGNFAIGTTFALYGIKG